MNSSAFFGLCAQVGSCWVQELCVHMSGFLHKLDTIFQINTMFYKRTFQLPRAVTILIEHNVNKFYNVPYIPECKPRIFGGFYKHKVEGLVYTRVYAPSEKNYIINIHTRFFYQIEISHVI